MNSVFNILVVLNMPSHFYGLRETAAALQNVDINPYVSEVYWNVYWWFFNWILILVGFYFWSAVWSVNAEDFCDASLCEQGQQVACNKPVGFGQECQQNPEEVTMTTELQQLIVSLHNERRSKVAVGSLPSFPSATDMLEMVCL